MKAVSALLSVVAALLLLTVAYNCMALRYGWPLWDVWQAIAATYLLFTTSYVVAYPWKKGE